jgi:hypothetical protein
MVRRVGALVVVVADKWRYFRRVARATSSPVLLAAMLCASSCTLPAPLASDGGSADGGPGPGLITKVDILFVVDTTTALADFREALVPGGGLLRGLEAGAGSLDLHLGIISADLGAGEFTDVPGCQVGGDLGLLHHQSDLSECAPGLQLNPDDRFLVYSSGPPRIANFSGDLASAVACIVDIGTTTCPFRQPLASAMEALRGCDAGNCNQPLNAGFLRPDAFLALIIVNAPSDDGSAPPDSALWDPNGVCGGCDYCWFRYAVTCDGGDPGTAPGPRENCVPGSWDSDPSHQLYPVEDLAVFFKALKPDPRMVYVAVMSTAPDPIEVSDGLQGCPHAGVRCTIGDLNIHPPPGARLSRFTQLFDPDRARFLLFCDLAHSNDLMEQVGADIAGLVEP